MKNKLKAELWDKTQYLFRNYYDRMMHCVLYFDGRIDKDLFAKALRFQLDNVPVLHSLYHNNPIKPYWTTVDFDVWDVLTAKDVDDLDGAVEKFVTQRIPIEKNVQVQIALFYHGDKTAFVMVSNHMCFDGGDFKYFVTTLCANYTKLTLGGQNLQIKHGSRDYAMVYSSMSDEDEKTARGLFKNVSAVKCKHLFPLTEKRDGDCNRVIRRKIDGEKFGALRMAGKRMGYTLNDVMLAVYFRSLYEIIGLTDGDSLTVQSMVDLRRHMKNGGAETGLTNHTGFMSCTVDGVGKDVEETLMKVALAMKDNKTDKFLGLYGIPLLNLAYTILPHFLSETAIKIGYTNPYIGMSNIGSIKPEQYRMGNFLPYDGWYTGAIKSKPYMQLALITFENAVTFSIAICGNEDDDKIINKFFDILEKNIDELIEYEKAKG